MCLSVILTEMAVLLEKNTSSQSCFRVLQKNAFVNMFQLLGSSSGKNVNPRDVAQTILEKLPETDFYDKVTTFERERWPGGGWGCGGGGGGEREN